MRSRRFIALVLAMPAIAAWGDTETKNRPHFHASNIEFVAYIPTGTVAADVWTHRGYAYAGSRAYGEGVSIIDARDAVHARLIVPEQDACERAARQ